MDEGLPQPEHKPAIETLEYIVGNLDKFGLEELRLGKGGTVREIELAASITGVSFPPLLDDVRAVVRTGQTDLFVIGVGGIVGVEAKPGYEDAGPADSFRGKLISGAGVMHANPMHGGLDFMTSLKPGDVVTYGRSEGMGFSTFTAHNQFTVAQSNDGVLHLSDAGSMNGTTVYVPRSPN